MARPHLQLTTYGNVPSDVCQALKALIEGCYEALPAPPSPTVQVCLFDTADRLRAFLARERAEMGVGASDSEGFLASHDAWRGVPRITVCLERLAAVPPLVSQGAIRHEVAHTILHGSVAHYIFRLSRQVLARGRERGLDAALLQQLLYYVAIAVKDYEVARLLVDHGFQECQADLARHQLAVGEEDRLAWLLARRDPRARLLYFAAQLKPLLFARPLLELPAFAPSLQENIQEMLALLPEEDRGRLLQLVEGIEASLGPDSRGNIEAAFTLLLERL
ncbi:MAG: hypothetical protein ACE5MB_00645 [Anaerolineae bacterium]